MTPTEAYEACVRRFLADHPEHIAGTANDPAPDKPGLCLDKYAALAFAEWMLARGLTDDPAKLAANIAVLRAELTRIPDDEWGGQTP
jgi:hypothetical protein